MSLRLEVLDELEAADAVDLEPTEWPGVCSCLLGRYLIRFDPMVGRYRWALASFPDDGRGLKTHGSRFRLEDAVRDCMRNARARSECDAKCL